MHVFLVHICAGCASIRARGHAPQGRASPNPSALSPEPSECALAPRRMQLAFDKVVVHTPEPVPEAVDLPSTVTVMGQAIDVSPVRALLAPLAERVGGTLSSAGDVLSQTPGLQLPASQFSTWLLNTYVDEQLRVVRSDGGSVQVFVRQ